jgi:hypothetical protein
MEIVARDKWETLFGERRDGDRKFGQKRWLGFPQETNICVLWCKYEIHHF